MTAPWVQTYSGQPFDLMEPRAADVRISDVAHHLARIARFSGATAGEYGYSVAQHSMLVAHILEVWGGDAQLQLEGLLHDAGEAYYGDITAPVLSALRKLGAGEALTMLRGGVDAVVREAFGLAPVEPPLVKRADLVALAIERKLLMAPCDRAWDLPELADTRWTGLFVESPTRAERQFLDRYGVLLDATREAA